jgi:hypothetical protein
MYARVFSTARALTNLVPDPQLTASTCPVSVYRFGDQEFLSRHPPKPRTPPLEPPLPAPVYRHPPPPLTNPFSGPLNLPLAFEGRGPTAHGILGPGPCVNSAGTFAPPRFTAPETSVALGIPQFRVPDTFAPPAPRLVLQPPTPASVRLPSLMSLYGLPPFYGPQ